MRLLLWSVPCLPGLHLPVYGAIADGLFADHDLDVVLLESSPGAGRVKELAAGAGDFLLTAVLYYLQALADDAPLDVRFVAALHQRSSVAALVRDDSDIVSAEQLAGRRLGGPQDTNGLGWLVRECAHGLDRRGIGQPQPCPMSFREAVVALRDGQVDAVANLAELSPLVARAAGVRLRALPLGTPVYLSGLAAGGWVPPEVVRRMQEVLCETLRRQHDQPDRGLELMRASYPQVDAADAVASWSILQRYVAGGGEPGRIDDHQWEDSLAAIAAMHGLSSRLRTAARQPA